MQHNYKISVGVAMLTSAFKMNHHSKINRMKENNQLTEICGERNL